MCRQFLTVFWKSKEGDYLIYPKANKEYLQLTLIPTEGPGGGGDFLGFPNFVTCCFLDHIMRQFKRYWTTRGLLQSFFRRKVMKNYRHENFSFLKKMTEMCRRRGIVLSQ